MTRLRSSRRCPCCYGVELETTTVLREEATTELVEMKDVQREAGLLLLTEMFDGG